MTDKIEKFLAYEGRISVTSIESTNLAEEARKTHDLSPVVTAAFGRVLTMTAILGNEMKSAKDRLTVQVKGSGPIGTMVVTSNSFPMVKGYCTNPHIDLPLNDIGKLDVGRAVGEQGYINVIKDIGLKKPYIGISPLVSGEIAEDFANYLVNSEQRRCVVALGVLVNKDGVQKAGGYLINAMPDHKEEDINNIEQSVFKAGAMSKMLDQNLSLIDIAKKITGDENVQVIEENITPVYKCDCSKENMANGLVTIGKKELQDIIEQDRKSRSCLPFL